MAQDANTVHTEQDMSPKVMRALLEDILASESVVVSEYARPIVEYISEMTSFQSRLANFHLCEWEKTVQSYLTAFVSEEYAQRITRKYVEEAEKIGKKDDVELDIPEGEGQILCNVEFKLAYGGKILLNTTHFHVRRGRVYGLLGHNGCGKSTLMRAISNGGLNGFPGAEELMKLRACLVEHDLDGSHSTDSTLEFCMNEAVLAKLGRDAIYNKLKEMDFTDELIEKPICNLSGGWKMKLALCRAILLDVDLLLLDEPTNHLDVQKQQWLCDFINGPECKNVTVLVVSHDSKFLNKVLTDVIHYENMRLKRYTGNLEAFISQCPFAKAYFSIQDTEMCFQFPKPGPLEGVKSRTKAIIKADNISFTYPGGTKPIFKNVSVQLSQASRVACIGPNGAGKSTLIKCLVGETKPDHGGEVYRHENCRIAYVAQHAFHHIEKHLEKSPVEYIQWRFSTGVDKELQELEISQMTDEEKAKLKQNFVIHTRELASEKDEAGRDTGERQVIFQSMEPHKGDKIPGADIRSIKELISRRTRHNDYEYEVRFRNVKGDLMDEKDNLYIPRGILETHGFFKLMKQKNDEIAAQSGQTRPLTTNSIKEHCARMGLEEEFSVYGKMKNLSGGQKVKCVLSASMWMNPHLVVLDEPSNFLDRDSLGALSKAIQNFEGGCLVISHSTEFFESIAPETWEVPGDQCVHISGAEYLDDMRKKELAEEKRKKKLGNLANDTEAEEFDAHGNKIEKKESEQEVDRDLSKKLAKRLKELRTRMKAGDLSVEDEIMDIEIKLEEYKGKLTKEKEALKANKKKSKKTK